MDEPQNPHPTPLPPAPLPTAGLRWGLFLDVDGTLLGFMRDPSAVYAPSALTELLQQLHVSLGGALAVVSGRALSDIDRIFGHKRWAAAGLHGLELRYADGTCRSAQSEGAALARLREITSDLAARFPGARVEDKEHTVALHCGDQAQLAALSSAAREHLSRLPEYELQPGREVVEIKPVGSDKGKAVSQLCKDPPFAGRIPVYLGDDFTDEYAFAQVNQAGGISVRVGSREPSCANFTLKDPAAVEAWLRHVLAAISPRANSA